MQMLKKLRWNLCGFLAWVAVPVAEPPVRRVPWVRQGVLVQQVLQALQRVRLEPWGRQGLPAIQVQPVFRLDLPVLQVLQALRVLQELAVARRDPQGQQVQLVWLVLQVRLVPALQELWVRQVRLDLRVQREQQEHPQVPREL